MKKIRIKSELALFFALIILAISIVFVIKADFGMTVVQSPAYVLSLSTPSISLGSWNYIIQGSLTIIMILIVRSLRISYIVSFISGIIYGLLLDLFEWLMRDLIATSIYISILFFVIGLVTACIAVALFFTCKAPLMPYDIFIREISRFKRLNISKFKWAFDISCLIIAIIVSLIITGKVIGLGIGTVIFALLVSPLMTQIMKIINRFIEFEPILKDRELITLSRKN